MAKKRKAAPTRPTQRGGRRAGAGRPASLDPGETVTARIPASLVVRLDAWAAAHDLNRSQAIAAAVRRLVGK